MRWIFLFALLVWSFAAQAQDYKRQYRHAKELFSDTKYSDAMEAFKALTVYDKENLYAEYSSFYYAMSAHRLGYASVAKDMLLQIKKLYPEWNQLDEVNYLLSKIYFDQKEYFQGRSIMNEVKDFSFLSDLRNLKQTYLAQIEDPETLRMMLEEYPDDVEVAKLLVTRLGQVPYYEQDTVLINSVINQYGLNKSELVRETAVKPIKKDTIRVALVMPFLAATLEPSPTKKRNQFILELYQGMKMAADTLSKSGIPVKLLAYDNERSNETTKNLVKKEELKGVDLLVGPFFQEESKPLQEFSITHKVGLVINPLSNNSDLVKQNPFGFLFQPSHETIAMRSAELAAEKARKKNCIVYYGESSKDSLMAAMFVAKAQELELKVLHKERVTKETSGSILSKLATATEFDEWKNPLQFSLKKDSIGCIFVATSNELIYSKIINSVETRKDSILVIGQEDWLDDTSVDFNKFERTGAILAAPNFKSVQTPAFTDFRKKYMAAHGVLPTEYAGSGYEFMMSLCKMMNQFGVNFLQTMGETDYVRGTLGAGVAPSKVLHDNTIVPFVHIRNGKLRIVE